MNDSHTRTAQCTMHLKSNSWLLMLLFPSILRHVAQIIIWFNKFICGCELFTFIILSHANATQWIRNSFFFIVILLERKLRWKKRRFLALLHLIYYCIIGQMIYARMNNVRSKQQQQQQNSIIFRVYIEQRFSQFFVLNCGGSWCGCPRLPIEWQFREKIYL